MTYLTKESATFRGMINKTQDQVAAHQSIQAPAQHTRPQRPRRRVQWALALAAVLSVVVVLAVGVVASGVLLQSSEPQGAGASPQPSPATPTGPVGAEDGYIPTGEPLPYDSTAPALTKLEPPLRKALRKAGQQAAAEGVNLRVTSGWRSARLQQQLYDDALQRLGETEAVKLVKSPTDSEHVHGRAVDIGPTDAAVWMGSNGHKFGFCQTYANEIWHFELAADDQGRCPQPVPDASHNPATGNTNTPNVPYTGTRTTDEAPAAGNPGRPGNDEHAPTVEPVR